jgi:hypothetical protein
MDGRTAAAKTPELLGENLIGVDGRQKIIGISRMSCPASKQDQNEYDRENAFDG